LASSADMQKMELIKTGNLVRVTLPFNYNSSIEFFKDGLEYRDYDVFRYHLKYTFLLPNGNIYNVFKLINKSVLYESQLHLHNKYIFKQLIKNILKAQLHWVSGESKCLVAFDAWSGNHYHFINDLLPRLLLVPDEIRKERTLILPDCEYLQKNALTVLALFSLSFKEIRFIKQNELFLIKDVIFISRVTHIGNTHSTLFAELRLRYLQNKKESVKGMDRIYIKRRNTSIRIVLNEAEVEELLTNTFNVKSVYFEDFSLAEQFAIASSASLMIGMHGAGLTNMVTMAPGSSLIEFRRDGLHTSHPYWHMASALGIHYAPFFGEPDDETKTIEGGPKGGCNLHIDIEALKALVQKAINIHHQNPGLVKAD
jgi:hypothetical protein